MDLASITALFLAYRYWILLPLAIIEGPMLAFACGILASLDLLDPRIAFGILVLGDILPDTFYYALGRYSAGKDFVYRLAARVGISSDRFADAEHYWHTYPARTMFMTKFAYGISSAFLFMAGVMRLPLRMFYGYSVSISVVHYAVIMLVGYYFGSSIAGLGNVIAIVEYGIAGAVLIVAAYVIVIWYMRKRFAWNTDREKTDV